MGFHDTTGYKMGFFVDKVMFCQKIFLEAMIKKYENKPLKRLRLQYIYLSFKNIPKFRSDKVYASY